MKKSLLIVTTLLLSLAVTAQPADFHRLYHTYKGEEGIVALRVPGALMKLGACFAGLDYSERELLRSLKSVSVLTIEEKHLYPGVNFAEEMDRCLNRGDYKLMLKVQDGREDVIIAAREKKGRIRDLIIVVGGEENTMVHVKGRMKIDLLEDLAQVTGMKELKVTAQIKEI